MISMRTAGNPAKNFLFKVDLKFPKFHQVSINIDGYNTDFIPETSHRSLKTRRRRTTPIDVDLNGSVDEYSK